MIKTVLDTNILISASFWKGKPYQIIKLGINNKIEIYSSIEILQEYEKILKRDFQLQQEEIAQRTNNYLKFIKIVKPEIKINLVKKDPDDNKFIETAITANANYIISGDTHLLEIKKYENIKIIKAAQFLKETEQKEY